MKESNNVSPTDDMVELVLWSIVGRLTTSLLHEINNPMQSIRGAAALGLEELDDPESLQTYFQMILHESGRVSEIIARARRIYRPERQTPECLDMNHLLQELVVLLRKLFERHQVQVKTAYAPGLPMFTAVFGHISFVILYPLLNMITEVTSADGGELLLETRKVGDCVEVIMQLEAADFSPKPQQFLPYTSLAARYDIELHEYAVDTGYVIRLHFPLQII
ncbi:MAG: hypothetical protein H6665_12470 [Ardenticatenaceae bacterium]|nr:hypothetical protein [Ardenticatenaceae bacterium]